MKNILIGFLILFCIGSLLFYLVEKDVESNVVERESVQPNRPLGQKVQPKKNPLPKERPIGIKQAFDLKVSSNTDVNFNGLVLDQANRPIASAKVLIKILSYNSSFDDYSTGGDERVTLKLTKMTDDNGRFSVMGETGISLTIVGIQKDGFISSSKGGRGAFVYSNLSSGKGSELYHKASPENPVIYRMWANEATEPLVRLGARLRIDPKKNIRVAYIPLVLGGRPTSSPSPNWDIKVSGENRRSLDRGGDDYWEVVFEAREGAGLLLADDSDKNIAPETGYVSKLKFSSVECKNGQRFGAYFRGVNNEKFAAFDFRFSFAGKSGGGKFSVFLEGVRINLGGSTNLMFDPNKEIQ